MSARPVAAIPSDWTAAVLRDHIHVKHGFAFKSEYFGADGPYALLTPGNFYDDGGFKAQGDRQKRYDGPVPEEFIHRPGDLVVAMTEQAEGLLGSSALVPQGDVYLHNQRVGLVTSQTVDRCFLFYLFNYKPVRAQISASASGTKVRHTSPTRIGEVCFGLPPLNTQRRIAAILSAYDDLIQVNARRVDILEEMSRRLFDGWFVNVCGPVAEAKGSEPAKWPLSSFSTLADFVNGYAFEPSDWETTGRPIIKIRELKRGVTGSTPRHSAILADRYLIRSGDLLFSWSGDLDAYLWAGEDGWLNQHLFKVLPKAGTPLSFIFLALRNSMPEFRVRTTGTTMKHIKRSALDQVKIRVPPPGLLSAFDRNCAPLLRQIIVLKKSICCLRTARDLLLPKLISGEIDLTSRARGLNAAADQAAAE